MMFISLVGIIGVQVVWIKNAIGIRNDSFDNNAIAGIQEAVKSIEMSHKTNFLNDFMSMTGTDSYNCFESGATGYLKHETVTSYGEEGNANISISNRTYSKEAGKDAVIISYDTVIKVDESPVIVPLPDNPGKMTIVPQNKIAGHPYIKEKDFLNWIRKRANEFQSMSDQMISEIYQWEKTMDLDPREIDFALKKSLAFSGINTPFKFAIIKNGSVSDESYSRTECNNFLKSKYMVPLFPDNIIRRDINLSVVFPERTNYVMGSMSWILFASLLFSLIILATFGFSLYFIVYQKKTSEMKSDFINNMTHEFKTPIATISLAADTIVNRKIIGDELKIRHFISMIKKENSRMNKKVETILQMASLDKQEIEFKFESVSIHKIIRKAVDSFDILVQQKHGTINLRLDASNSEIYGDSEHLYNLINNLLDNAVKYSADNLEINVETKNNRDGVVISVRDNGMGMSKSVQNKIFERFYRQTGGNIHNVKGFGLGLNYVQSIVEAHKGTITVSSEPGKGSDFEVFLPFNAEKD